MTNRTSFRGAIGRFHHGEEGMYSMVSLVVILMLLILYGMVGNSATTVRDRIRVQNAADSAAYTGAVWMARAMNVVTMTNHMIGEMMAFVVIHHAIGGKELEEGGSPAIPSQPFIGGALTAAHLAATAVGYGSTAYSSVGQTVQCGATVYSAKMRLKQILTIVYRLAAIGQSLTYYIPYVPIITAGRAICAFCRTMEAWVAAEWASLTMFETIARTTIPLKLALWQAIKASTLYTKALVGAAPALANRNAQYLGQMNMSTAAVWPEPGDFGTRGYSALKLPLAEDTASGGSIAQSQIVRASYPWIVFHRQPVLDMLQPFFLSRAKSYYDGFSQDYTLERARELYQSSTNRMLVIDGTTPYNKGSEAWRTNWRQAEPMFSLVGLAHRNRPTVLSPAYFGTRENQQGLVGFAQATIYSATQERSRGGGQQSILGWDTLNWSPSTGSIPEYPAAGRSSGPSPRVQVNWQAVMTPVGRLDELGGGGSSAPAAPSQPFGAVVEKMMLPIPAAMRNH